MEEIKKCVICGNIGGSSDKSGLYIVKTEKEEYAFHIHHTNGIKHLKEKDFEGRFLTVTTPEGIVYYMRKEFGVPFISKVKRAIRNAGEMREKLAKEGALHEKS